MLAPSPLRRARGQLRGRRASRQLQARARTVTSRRLARRRRRRPRVGGRAAGRCRTDTCTSTFGRPKSSSLSCRKRCRPRSSSLS